MAEITAALVKRLRDKTGAGMMDCKKALSETGGDIEAAVDWLRKNGLAVAAKKAGRVASEGLVGIVVRDRAAAVVEVNAETDFVARNEDFQKFVATVAEIALADGQDLEALRNAPYPGAGKSVSEQLTDMIATIGENMALRRVAVLGVENGVIASYMHGALAPNLGKIGVLVALESAAGADSLMATGKNLAMHVAAANPQVITRDDLDPATLARERNFLTEQARDSGRPEEIIEKMVEGRLRKYFEEVCLLDQTYVIDDTGNVGAALKAAEKDAGAPLTVKAFARFALGEGIEKEEGDFAAEVAAAAGG